MELIEQKPMYSPSRQMFRLPTSQEGKMDIEIFNTIIQSLFYVLNTLLIHTVATYTFSLGIN